MTTAASLRSWPARVSVVAAVALGAGALTLLPGAAPTAIAAGLVPWSDCEALLDHHRTELARTASPYGVGELRGDLAATTARSSGGSGSVSVNVQPAAPLAGSVLAQSDSATAERSTVGAVGAGPTGTNVQERGVDEPDTAKTSGGVLYVSAHGRLQVLSAGAQPELLSSLPLGDGAFGAELLVDGARVLALVNGWRPAPGTPPLPEPLPVEPLPVEPGPVETLPVEPPLDPDLPLPVDPPVVDPAQPLPEQLPGDVEPIAPAPAPVAPAAGVAAPSSAMARDMAISVPVGDPFVSAVLVDVADPRAPRVLETLELGGRYVSARLVDGTVRLVTASSPHLVGVQPEAPYGSEQEQDALEQNRATAGQLSLEDVLPQSVLRDASGAQVADEPAVECADVQHAESAPQGVTTLLVTTLRPAQGLAALDSTAVTTDGDLVYASAERLYVATSRWGTVSPSGGIAPDQQDVTTELHAFDTSSPDSTAYLGSGSVPGYVYGRWALSAHDGHLRVATTLAPPWDGSQPSSSSVAVLAERDGGLVEVGRVDGLGVDERIFAVRYFGDIATVVTFRQTDPLYVLDLADPTSPKVLGELKIPGFSTYLHPIGDDRLLGIGQDADAQGRVTGMQLSLFDLTDLSKPTQVDRLSLGEGYSPAQDDSRAFVYDPARRLAVLPFSDHLQQRSSARGVRVTDGFELVDAGQLEVGAQTMVERALLVDGVVHAITPEGVVAGDVSTFARTGTAGFAGVPAVDEPVIQRGGSSGSSGAAGPATVD